MQLYENKCNVVCVERISRINRGTEDEADVLNCSTLHRPTFDEHLATLVGNVFARARCESLETISKLASLFSASILVYSLFHAAYSSQQAKRRIITRVYFSWRISNAKDIFRAENRDTTLNAGDALAPWTIVNLSSYLLSRYTYTFRFLAPHHANEGVWINKLWFEYLHGRRAQHHTLFSRIRVHRTYN